MTTFEPTNTLAFAVNVPSTSAFPLTTSTFEPSSETQRFEPTWSVSVGCVFATPTEFDVYSLPYTCTLISSSVMSSTISIVVDAAPFVHRPMANSSMPGFPAGPGVASLEVWCTYPMNVLLSFAWWNTTAASWSAVPPIASSMMALLVAMFTGLMMVAVPVELKFRHVRLPLITKSPT